MKTLIVFLGITEEKIKGEYDRCYALTKIRNFPLNEQLEGVFNCKGSLDKKASYSISRDKSELSPEAKFQTTKPIYPSSNGHNVYI